MRFIECAVTVDKDIDLNQGEYLINSCLIDTGFPIEPLTGELKHGEIHCVPDALNPLKLKYFWHGEDLRS